jgi:hypothetical protein
LVRSAEEQTSRVADVLLPALREAARALRPTL